MAESFKLEIFSPKLRIGPLEVSEVVVPAYDGECGLLADHENYIGLLGTGILRYRIGDKEELLMVSSGAFEALGGSVVVLADVVRRRKDVDLAEVSEKLKLVQDRLANYEKCTPEEYPGLLKELRELEAQSRLLAGGPHSG